MDRAQATAVVSLACFLSATGAADQTLVGAPKLIRCQRGGFAAENSLSDHHHRSRQVSRAEPRENCPCGPGSPRSLQAAGFTSAQRMLAPYRYSAWSLACSELAPCSDPHATVASMGNRHYSGPNRAVSSHWFTGLRGAAGQNHWLMARPGPRWSVRGR